MLYAGKSLAFFLPVHYSLKRYYTDAICCPCFFILGLPLSPTSSWASAPAAGVQDRAGDTHQEKECLQMTEKYSGGEEQLRGHTASPEIVGRNGWNMAEAPVCCCSGYGLCFREKKQGLPVKYPKFPITNQF